MNWSSEKLKAHRAARTAAGLCSTCSRPAQENRKQCIVCAARNRQACKERYEELKAAGSCIDCKAETGGGVRCPPCAAADRAKPRNPENTERARLQKRQSRLRLLMKAKGET